MQDAPESPGFTAQGAAWRQAFDLAIQLAGQSPRMHWLRFNLERLLLRGVGYRLLFAALIIGTISLLVGVAMSLHPAFDDPLDAIWWAFLRLTDTGYLGDDEGAGRRVVSTLLTVSGAVLFIGLLVAILTQWMGAWLQKIERGLSPLRIRGHILVLGWNYHTPIVILELLRTRNRVERFLQGQPARALRIVVLADEVDAQLRRRLRDHLGEHWNDSRVILRAGDPLQIDSLRDACFSDAAAVILPGADFVSARPGISDIENIKALASISRYGRDAGRLPTAVAALYRGNRRGISGDAYGGTLVTVEADLYIARIIAQSALTPGAWEVLEELLAISSGNAIFLRSALPEPSLPLSAYRQTAGTATLLGVVRGGDGSVLLNPQDDPAITAGDTLVYIARSYDDSAPLQGTAALAEEPRDGVAVLQPVAAPVRRALILGYSRRVPLLVSELLEEGRLIEHITLVGTKPVAERDPEFAAFSDPRLEHRVVNFLDPDVLASLDPRSYDVVILVARESLGDEASADSATLANWLSLASLGIGGRGTRVLAEVLEQENAELFDPRRADVILSPLYVSYLLSQLALEPQLGDVYRELLQPWGANVELRRIDAESGRELHYADLCAQAAADGELAIGLKTPVLNDGRTLLNPPADTRWDHSDGDQLLVLAESENPDKRPRAPTSGGR